MRTLLLLSVVATLAACADEQPATAPRSTPTATVPMAQAGVDAPTGLGKPVSGPVGFTTVTVVTSNEFSTPGGAIAGQAYCPAGTTRISGGYAFTSEGNPSAPPIVTQNQPFGNGWWVRILATLPGSYGGAFKVYVLCAS